MSTRTITTRIQLRRNTEAEFDRIKDTFIPLKGEVLLVETVSDGVRCKIGDGIKTFAQLPYSDKTVRDLIESLREEIPPLKIDTTTERRPGYVLSFTGDIEDGKMGCKWVDPNSLIFTRL